MKSLEGLAPAVAISQAARSNNPRSTVATITEIYDHLRVLYAGIGVPHCPRCGREIGAQSREAILRRLLDQPKGTRVMVMAPLERGRRGEFMDLFEDLKRKGFGRVRADGEVFDLLTPPRLDRRRRHDLDLVVDRLVLGADIQARAGEAVDVALEMGGGDVLIAVEGGGLAEGRDETLLSRRFACPDCGISLQEPTHASFSFNSPRGMCPDCEGLGTSRTFDPERLIEHPEKSVVDGAVPMLPSLKDRRRRHWFEGAALHYGFDLDTPWRDLKPEHQQVLVYGSGGELLDFYFRHWKGWEWRHRDPFEGIVAWLTFRYKKAKSELLRRKYESYMRLGRCPTCSGKRLRPESLAVTLGGLSIADVAAMTVAEAGLWFAALKLPETALKIGEDALKEVSERLTFLGRVGLGYLALDRTAPTLAGGEAQRLRLASQVGAGLSDCLYVLDEPSIGLHPRDQGMLLDTLRALRDRDNTVIVVEHDEQTMLAADWIVDFGPGAGHLGGKVVAQGTPAQIRKAKNSLTGQYLARTRSIETPTTRRVPDERWLVLRNARQNNLKGIDVGFPLGLFICVTGVSGSGKSSLVSDTLHPALAKALHDAEVEPGEHDGLDGLEHLDKAVLVDQDPIGRTPRSNPATYVGVFDHIRAFFAELPESRARGYKAGRFSFNTPEGRCPACEGYGARRVESDFLADVWIPCEICGETRFGRETLQVEYKGKNVADVLAMEVREAAEFFGALPKIARRLEVMRDVGLGYVKLGQPATTLSGGEAQRVKLAEQLARPRSGRGIYVLDEPTTGLHLEDVRQLLQVMRRFVDEGNTVVIVEHHPDVIKSADWVIDLGPEGGAEGGRIVAEGSPEDVALVEESHTAKILQRVLAGDPVAPPPGPHRRGGSSRTPNIEVHGAREHNLKGISAQVPRKKLTVFSGVSGSGKTSMALDTIYAEGQRRFVESLSSYARQFVSQMPKPKVDQVSGLSPAIAIDQRGVPWNPRATVGTMTQVYDYMRVLFARLATPFCPECGAEIGAQTVDRLVDRVLIEFAGQRVMILGPIMPDRGEDYPDVFARLQRQGWLRVRIDGEVLDLPVEREISRRRQHQVEAVVDRVHVDAGRRTRLAEAVERATEISGGEVVVAPIDGGEETRASLMYGCPSCGRAYEPLTPRHFSFNHPQGWCPMCEGLGVQQGVDLDALLTDPERSLRQGAVAIWGPVDEASSWGQVLAAVGAEHGFNLDQRLKDFGEAEQRALLYGSAKWVALPGGLRVRWRGLVSAIEDAAKMSSDFRERYGRGIGEVPCPDCGGGRLRPEAAAAKLSGRTIVDLSRLPLSEDQAFFADLGLAPAERHVAGEVYDEIRSRLRFLVDVGVDYLTLHRPGPTLSGGEAQRVRLAGQLGSDLTGVLYVMDEPTIGIHPRDNEKMLRVIKRLRAMSNTVIVVEHDPQTIEEADYLLDFGPGAGPQGGRVVAHGTPAALRRNSKSLTGRFMAGKLGIPVPEVRRAVEDGQLIVEGCRQNNLRDITVHMPLGCLVAVTGPSGSGKSTLMQDIVYLELAYRLWGAGTTPGKHRVLLGWEGLKNVALLDQSPIGHSPRSNPATYVGVFDEVRRFFARLPEARVRGATAEHFSFNRRGGRCEECEGMGARLVQMHFLPDVWVSCEACGGRRYKPEILDVRYRGRNISDVLDLSMGEAAELFASFPRLAERLRMLCDMGLDYLPLGQAAPSLSGGEAQRLKIARELLKGGHGRTMYLLDEPTTGLHPADILKLLGVLNRLVDEGNTVVVIEHNMDLVKNADWVIDLGPGGGDAGGHLMAEGTPEVAAKAAGSPTAPYLRKALKDATVAPRESLTLPKRVRVAAEAEDEVESPWEADGRGWHLGQRLHQGVRVYWSAETLEKMIEALEKAGATTDYRDREHIYFRAPGEREWWAYIFTAHPRALTVVVRTPKGLLDEYELARQINLPAWRDMPETKMWPDTARVTVQTSARRYDRVVVRLLHPKDVNAAVRAMLRKAWGART